MIPCPRRPKQCRPGLRRAAPGNASAPPTQQRGFTYIGLLIAMAIIGAALAGAGVVWHTAQQREREAELLVVGDQIRLAIARYYNAVKGPAKQYPQSLDDLLRDPRLPSVARYLRKLYYDPITGTTKWGLVKDGNDRIMGVFSLSEEKPIKQANFSAVDGQFEGKEKYSDWRFVYQPKRARAKPAGMAQTPADMGIVNPKGTK